MKYTTHELVKNYNVSSKFAFEADLSSYIALDTDVIKLSPVEVKGYYKIYNDNSEFVFHLSINCIMTMLCAITLEEIEVPLDFNVIETFTESTMDEDNRVIDGITIDLLPIIWSNILLEKPYRVIKDGAELDEKIHVLDENDDEEYVNPQFKNLDKYK